jgi:S-adenosylmethionine hydrolase
VLVTFTTDFGNRDGYAGIMKGVVLDIDPRISCVDISNEVEPGNIRAAAWVVRNAYRYFPSGSVHLVVVDPGVGSHRRGIVLSSRDHMFVAPDNGVLSLVLPDANDWAAFEISNRELWRPTVSNTFHGRDIFAPVAAHLASGRPVKSVGMPIDVDGLVTFRQPVPAVIGNELRGSVVYIDRFGNLITNIEAEHLASAVSVHCYDVEIPLGQTYASVEPNSLVAYAGSHGFVEIGLNMGRADKHIGVNEGAPIAVLR